MEKILYFQYNDWYPTPEEASKFIDHISGDKVTDENLVINKSIALNEKIVVIRKGKKKYYLVKIA